MSTFKRAAREAIKIKLGVTGPSGSGKTLGALALARQLVGKDGKIAMIDTENGSASLYADRDEFDVIDLTPPYTSVRFLDAIHAAVKEGYQVVIIDSLSHQWEGEGGILDRKLKEEKSKPGANSFTLWGAYKSEHRQFVASLLHAPIHVIACLRSKTEYAQEGKRVTKVGITPITGENMEYEFSAVFDLSADHSAVASKDRTGLFEGKSINMLRDDPGGLIAGWLASGEVPKEAPIPAPAKPKTDLTTLSGADLLKRRAWAQENGKPRLVDLVNEELARRAADKAAVAAASPLLAARRMDAEDARDGLDEVPLPLQVVTKDEQELDSLLAGEK